MNHTSFKSHSCDLLNQQLKRIHQRLDSYIKIYIQTPGWAVTGWLISIKDSPAPPLCTIDRIEAITIQTTSDTLNKKYCYFISPRFNSSNIGESQILEISLPECQNMKVIKLKAYDRISVWQLLHLVRQDISKHQSLRINSWIMDGRQEMNLLHQDASVTSHLNEVNKDSLQPNFYQYIWDKRPDVQKEFGSVTSISYKDWLLSHGKKEHGLMDLTTEGKLSIQIPKAEKFQNRPFGVNIFGYESSLLGIGEDLRTCRDALNFAGIPTTTIDIPTTHTSDELRYHARENFDQIAPYAINLICMTAEEHARVFLELGMSVFIERFNIGYWPWELSEWPHPWRPLFGLVDEVWASSKFTYSALNTSLKHTQETKLTYMPLSVSPIKPLSNQKKISVRKAFHLLQDSFVIICSFDGRSSFFRKNPWGAINAFQKAFPTESNNSTTLIIKTMHAAVDQPEWEKLKKITELDNRIKLIDKKLSREEIINLYGCCDTLISLHRAEGFGRILAESLMLGLNVVATNYSGNTDFCNGAYAYPIDYDLIPIAEGEYVHSKNQYWAEPRIDHAASVLYNLYVNHKASKRIAKDQDLEGSLEAYHNKLSIYIVGLNYKYRLIQIWKNSRIDRQKRFRWARTNCFYGIKDS